MFYVKHVKCKKSGYIFICMYVTSEYLMLHDHLKRNYINSYIDKSIQLKVWFTSTDPYKKYFSPIFSTFA